MNQRVVVHGAQEIHRHHYGESCKMHPSVCRRSRVVTRVRCLCSGFERKVCHDGSSRCGNDGTVDQERARAHSVGERETGGPTTETREAIRMVWLACASSPDRVWSRTSLE